MKKIKDKTTNTKKDEKEKEEILSFLKENRILISNDSLNRIYKKYGTKTKMMIEDNPYLLVLEGVRTRFNYIDEYGAKIGFYINSKERVSAGILYYLRMIAEDGNTCIKEDILIEKIIQNLSVEKQDVEDNIKNLVSLGKIKREKRFDKLGYEEYWIYDKIYYDVEKEIVKRLHRILKSRNKLKINDVTGYIKKVTDINLSAKQKEAIKLINDNNVTIITGGPGTGKTTIIKTVIGMYQKLGKKIVLCAPTGRAAKRMSEATGMNAETIHRALGLKKIDDDDIPKSDLDIEPIDADLIIVDEMSMVDMFLMNYLLKGIYSETKVVMVGDVDQLPSIRAGEILKDLIKSNKVPYIELTKIFRQASKSKIIVNAHKVNSGENFDEDVETFAEMKEKKDDTDFDFIEEGSIRKVLDDIIGIYDLNKTQVICPTKRGYVGTENLNRLLQDKFNPKKDEEDEKKWGDTIFRLGDKVMQNKNNYDISWITAPTEKFGIKQYEELKNKAMEFFSKYEYLPEYVGSGIFNGEIGTIIKVTQRGIYIRFDDKIAEYELTNLNDLLHAYAITIHKSQGSEFDDVIIPIMPMTSKLLSRNLLYTGMTRAKKHLTIIGNKLTINLMINGIKDDTRNSGLLFKLEEEL